MPRLAKSEGKIQEKGGANLAMRQEVTGIWVIFSVTIEKLPIKVLFLPRFPL
jgi:hypothetical protein